ncbi:MAG TPA: sulfite exporter TauE/SafE family protein [Xanthobacteraceae bacterium]|nr:sulfite exporter TauE/SafE family protein [Xanthobacteraceae bacterium]
MTIITDPLFYLFAVPAVVMLGLSKGGFSGIGMVSTPLLALTMPPLQAAAILLPIILLQDAISVWVYRRDWDAWNMKVMLPGAVLGVGAAWLFAAYVSDAVILLAVGAIGLALCVYAWFWPAPPKTDKRPNAAYGAACGGLAGFTSTLIQIGAPPYYVFVLPQRLDKIVYVATTAWFFAAVNVMKVVPYFALGQFSTAGLATSFVLFPLAIASNFFGIWLVRVTPTALFYRITYLIVFLLSLELTRRGVFGLIWPA